MRQLPFYSVFMEEGCHPHGIYMLGYAYVVAQSTDILWQRSRWSPAQHLTWSRTGPTLKGPVEITGFAARTKTVGTMVGEYGSQVTRTPGTLNPKEARESKEARIGSITTPELKK
jgi:hypothetical protein